MREIRGQKSIFRSSSFTSKLRVTMYMSVLPLEVRVYHVTCPCERHERYSDRVSTRVREPRSASPNKRNWSRWSAGSAVSVHT